MRPEQISLVEQEPASPAPTLGRGTIVEETFAGATRRLRVRLPPSPGVRQVVPPLPFGEEAILLDVDRPRARPPRRTSDPWVVLQEWHILRQPTPRLLVCDSGEGVAPALELVPPLLEALDGVATVLGVAPDARRRIALRETLSGAPREAGLGAAAVRVRRGDPAEQIAIEHDRGALRLRHRGRRRSRVPEGPPRFAPASSKSSPRSPRSRCSRRAGAPASSERILICTAIGEPGKADVRAGGWLARRLGATVTLLHVTPPGPRAAALRAGAPRAGRRDAARARRALRFSVREAEAPVDGILDEMRAEPTDLVVLGAGSRVTRQVLRACGCSILVVPEGSW